LWCVPFHRKLVIGFAFLVPDVAYNEAYISFIFTHPEWRRAGIGSFLLYHLIQVTFNVHTFSWALAQSEAHTCAVTLWPVCRFTYTVVQKKRANFGGL